MSEVENTVLSLRALVDINNNCVRELIASNDKAIRDLMAEKERSAQTRHDSNRRELDAAMRNAEMAVAKAETSYEKRFETNNEWKSTFATSIEQWKGMVQTILSDQLPRQEYTTAHRVVVDRLVETNARVALIEGRSSGISSSLGVILAVVALAISVTFGIVNMTRGHSNESKIESLTLPAPLAPIR